MISRAFRAPALSRKTPSGKPEKALPQEAANTGGQTIDPPNPETVRYNTAHHIPEVIAYAQL
jgi:hypothetical protein